jgi:hypothetical protein
LDGGSALSQCRYLHGTTQTQKKRVQISISRVRFEPTVPVGNPLFNGKYFWFADRLVKSDVKLHELNGNCLTRALKKE